MHACMVIVQLSDSSIIIYNSEGLPCSDLPGHGLSDSLSYQLYIYIKLPCTYQLYIYTIIIIINYHN